MERPIRVCYFGTYRPNYSRNQIMIEGLRRAGVEVIECNEPLWHGIEDRVRAASGGWLSAKFLARVGGTYRRLVEKHRQVGDYDVMVLGYPGQLDVPLARVLTWMRRKPLVLDVFMSIYLIAAERGLTARHPLTARLIYGLEKLACALPDLLILDTEAYVRWFQRVYGVDPARFCLVPTGADDRVFHPTQVPPRHDGKFLVVYHGSFIPNHGVEYIVEAAALLRDTSDIHFELIGDGPERDRVQALAERYGLTNVTFTGWVDKEELPDRIARADVCLGVFGTTPQSMMTVQNKIYETLAMGKPLITGESPTIRRVFEDGKHLLLCRRADARSLADAIIKLRGDKQLRMNLARRGNESFAKFSVGQVGSRLAAIISRESVLGRITRCSQ